MNGSVVHPITLFHSGIQDPKEGLEATQIQGQWPHQRTVGNRPQAQAYVIAPRAIYSPA